jgi:hypothetical protein
LPYSQGKRAFVNGAVSGIGLMIAHWLPLSEKNSSPNEVATLSLFSLLGRSFFIIGFDYPLDCRFFNLR